MKQSKTCASCGEHKPASEFYTRTNKGKEYLYSWCKQCTSQKHKISRSKRTKEQKERINRQNNFYRNRQKQEGTWKDWNRQEVIVSGISYTKGFQCRIKKLYGLTLEDYTLKVGTDPKCEICQCDLRNTKKCIDHNHKTGDVRGILCNLCNSALGKFREDTTILTKAIEYVNKYRNSG